MCRPGYDGPRCQQTSRSFRGDGWAWLPPLSLCERTHLSVEFTTRRKDGLILYNGPITAPEADQPVVSGESSCCGTTSLHLMIWN